MKATTLLSITPLLSSAVTAFAIPAGLADGVYLVSTDSNSTDVFEKVDIGAYAPVRRNAGSSETSLVQRDVWADYDLGDSGQWFPNHGDYDRCTEAMRNFFLGGNTIGHGKKVFSLNGAAVLAVCNYLRSQDFDHEHFGFRPTLSDGFNGIADARFGAWKTGWVHFKGYQTVSYGMDITVWRDLGNPKDKNDPARNICGNM